MRRRIFDQPAGIGNQQRGTGMERFKNQTVVVTGGGGGIAIRVMRAAQLVVTAARGDGVTRWYVSSGWSW